MTALIIGSGDFGRESLKYAIGADIIICADGGFDNAVRYGIEPDIILGDMDSVNAEVNIKSIVFPREKNQTDSEIAIDYAVSKGCERIIMTGVTGTRLDHTLNNIFLLEYIARNGVSGMIADEHNEIYFFSGEAELSGTPGDLLSVIPINGDVCGVTNYGLKYKLSDETLEFGTSRGISNEFTEDSCRITAKSGKAVIIKSRE